MAKELINQEERTIEVEQLVYHTDDHHKYTFALFRWMDNPVFLHKSIPESDSRRDRRNVRLPQCVRKALVEEYDHYYNETLMKVELADE